MESGEGKHEVDLAGLEDGVGVQRRGGGGGDQLRSGAEEVLRRLSGDVADGYGVEEVLDVAAQMNNSDFFVGDGGGR